jgi:beta-carotene 3-hydroxylase
MIVLINSLIILLSFCTMEAVAWMSHKFLMHGFLWKIHEDHHTGSPHTLQRNDSFFLIFAIPSWLFMMFGVMDGCDYKLYIGIGIAVYGIAYFFVHEVVIHQRLKFFSRTKNRYLLALRRAHKMHHKHLGKEDGECFGMLYVPKKYFLEAGIKSESLFER